MTSLWEEAGRWFLRSGIQEPSGGVARYYRSDLGRNAPVSNEITGYAVSTLLYLHQRSGDPEYLDRAESAARYLTQVAWDSSTSTFPFEPASACAYFFDLGIIVRGLLAAWRATGQEEFHARAQEAALSMAFDFLGDGEFYPIISLPDKQPVLDAQSRAAETRWSRRSGCYQLKAALAWHDLGNPEALRLFDAMLGSSLATHEAFLSGEPDREKLMDRLHAYCYFLEALMAVADRESARRALGEGIDRVATLLREIAPAFERSDVCGQLLRIRLIAHHAGAVPLDEKAACEEADRAVSYQAASPDPRIHGGFWFGQKNGVTLPYVNPVSTGFCLQALALWQDHRAGTWRFELPELI